KMKINDFLLDEGGQSESVFKLALVVIIIAAVLAVVAFVMGGAWSGAGEIKEQTVVAGNTTNQSTRCLLTGEGCK
ncbi:MAG: hypothetical protein JXB14_00460, partial [Candidatus Altiarchaeota archaeon]|nr:hypothetical protein [Candidatus Altiarchaeota archaeon]